MTIRKWLRTPELSSHPDTKTDRFKVSGAYKIITEAAAGAETQEALAAAVRERAGEMNRVSVRT